MTLAQQGDSRTLGALTASTTMVRVVSTLILVRHAKAKQFGPSDHERALSERGWADAAVAGTLLAEQGMCPDLALVSTALRTQQTWEQVARAAGWGLEPCLDNSLYAADADTVLDLLRAVPDDTATVVVVGHNPTMASLAQLLDDGSAEEMVEDFATSALAVFDHEGSWQQIGQGRCRLVTFQVARA